LAIAASTTFNPSSVVFDDTFSRKGRRGSANGVIFAQRENPVGSTPATAVIRAAQTVP
jgi:hypothetical protein